VAKVLGFEEICQKLDLSLLRCNHNGLLSKAIDRAVGEKSEHWDNSATVFVNDYGKGMLPLSHCSGKAALK
jgi:hypothetical protein